MEVIADASALLAVALDEPERAVIIEATTGATLIAPAALPFEIGKALTAMYKRGHLEEGLVRSAWEATQKIPVRLVAIEIEAAITMAVTNGICAYDAYYLYCALAHQRPLVTLDRQMRAVAENLGIRLLV